MTVRFIVRPNHILTTPKRLKEAFGARGVRSTNRDIDFDYQRDFLLGLPNNCFNAPRGYAHLANLYSANKLQQRKKLQEAGFPIPPTVGCDGWSVLGPRDMKFVVRPLRHFGGQHYRITTDRSAYDPTREYISELYPKRHEYRIITVYGKPAVTLLKRIPEGLSPELPWNHTNGSSFVTVNNPDADRLRHTNIYDIIANSQLIKCAHILAIDVLVGPRNDYVVCEVNFSPSLSIQANINKVVEYALEARQ